jgi:hypothetical protein
MYKVKEQWSRGRIRRRVEGWSRSACIWRVQLQHQRHPPSSDLWACCEGSGPVARLLCKPPMALTEFSTKHNSYRAPRRLESHNSRFMLGAEHCSCRQKSDYQLFDAVPGNAGRIRKSVRLGEDTEF